MADSEKKRDILDHAFNMFYDRGFSLGVDAVMADAGISKRTLYKYFPSKEQLVIELLGHYTTNAINGLRAGAESLSPAPQGRLRALFEFRKSLLECSSYRGCFAVDALIEYRGHQPEIEAAANGMIHALHEFIHELCVTGGFRDAGQLAEEALILFQGATIGAQASHSTAPFDVAIRILDRIAIAPG